MHGILKGKKVIEVNNHRVGYFWFEQHLGEGNFYKLDINSWAIPEKGYRNRGYKLASQRRGHHYFERIRGVFKKIMFKQRNFFEKNKLEFIEENKKWDIGGEKKNDDITIKSFG